MNSTTETTAQSETSTTSDGMTFGVMIDKLMQGGIGQRFYRLSWRPNCWIERKDSAPPITYTSPSISIFWQPTSEDMNARDWLQVLPVAKPIDPDGSVVNECGDDASKWALYLSNAIRKSEPTRDELHGFLVGWFSNAIEHSCDIRLKQLRESYSQIEKQFLERGELLSYFVVAISRKGVDLSDAVLHERLINDAIRKITDEAKAEGFESGWKLDNRNKISDAPKSPEGVNDRFEELNKKVHGMMNTLNAIGIPVAKMNSDFEVVGRRLELLEECFPNKPGLPLLKVPSKKRQAAAKRTGRKPSKRK